jgi:tRNA(Arg) A34 adenosine deaminase TadA
MTNNPDRNKRNTLMASAGLLAFTVCRVHASTEAQMEALQQPAEHNDQTFIERAFVMRQAAVDSGDQAYGAVIVRDGRIVGQSPSRVLLLNDPTAHAEMEAIRDASRRLGSRMLRGCTLYSSSPACPMCEAAAYWAGIERQVSGSQVVDGGRPELCG